MPIKSHAFVFTIHKERDGKAIHNIIIVIVEEYWLSTIDVIYSYLIIKLIKRILIHAVKVWLCKVITFFIVKSKVSHH